MTQPDVSPEIVIPIMGAVFLALGFFNITSRPFVEWGLGTGPARLWSKMLGQERAVKLTRYFFGLMLCLIGLLCLLLTLAHHFMHE